MELYCNLLYCIVLYCIVLYCIVLYCIVLYCIVLFCIVRPYAEGRLDRYRIGIPRELSEIRTQPWLCDGSLTCDPQGIHLLIARRRNSITVCLHVGMNVTMSEVSQIVKDLPNGKFSGLNGESMKHAHPLLCLLLSISFTSMLKHCYMPQSMINSVIIPTIKNKSGDFIDKNNDRPIALSSIISKVFDYIIAIRLEE